MLRHLVDIAREVRGAIRVSQRGATNSLAIVLTIALGLGATAAILSVIRPALLQPLPYEDADRLVSIWEQPIGSSEGSRTSFPTLLDWRARSTAFSGLEAVDGTNVSARIGDQAEMLSGARVTPGFFALLGVQPIRGRASLPRNDDPGADPVVISYRLAARLGGEQVALGQALVLNGALYTVIGVLPPSFGEDDDVWLPLLLSEADRSSRSSRRLGVIGRLRDGVDPSSARLDLARVMSMLAAEYPADMEGRTVGLSSLRDALLGNVKPILVSLLAAVTVLLVITVANLGALMLLRNLNRRNEFALRAALGASRGRLVRQLFIEGLVLAIAGAVLSFYVGRLGVGLMLRAIPENLRSGMPYLADARVDMATVSVVFVIATIMAAAFALGPAWRTVRALAPIGHGMRLTVGKADRRLRRILVAGQLGLTVVLLTGTTQLAASLVNLLRQEVGVASPDQLLTMNVAASGPAYDDAPEQRRFYEELVARAAALPGVLGATAVFELPLSGSGMTTFETVDRPIPMGQRPQVAIRMFAGEYFATLGVPLRDGRLVGSRDRAGTTPAVVVSASLADRIGADGGPVLGRRIRLTRTGDTQWEIVGVVGDVQMGKLDSEPPPTVYVSHLQAADNRLHLVVRTALPPAVAPSLRELVRDIDPTIPVHSITTIGQRIRNSHAVFARRFPLVIVAVFAASALVLAIVGLYSLCAHEVVSRRREFGIRLVLGASPVGVRMVMLRDGLALTLLGVLGGVLAAIPASQLVRSLLFGVRAVDPYIYGGVAIGVLAAAMLATALPAWRGSVEHFVAALRSD